MNLISMPLQTHFVFLRFGIPDPNGMILAGAGKGLSVRRKGMGPISSSHLAAVKARDGFARLQVEQRDIVA